MCIWVNTVTIVLWCGLHGDLASCPLTCFFVMIVVDLDHHSAYAPWWYM